MNSNPPLKFNTCLDPLPKVNRSNYRRATRETNGRKSYRIDGCEGTSKPSLLPLDEAVSFIAATFASKSEAINAICYAPWTGHAGICTLGDVFIDLREEYKRPVPAYRVSQVCVGMHPGLGLILPTSSGTQALALTEYDAAGAVNHQGLPMALIMARADFEPLFVCAPQRPRRVMPRIYDDRLWFNFSMSQSTARTLDETIELPYR